MFVTTAHRLLTRNAVLENGGENRAVDKHQGDKETPCSITRSVILSLNHIQHRQRVPYELSENNS